MFTLLDVSKYCGMTSLSSAASTSEQSKRLESTLSVLRAAVTENRVIPERELDILTKQAELIGKRFSFLEIPDFWPLSLAKEMVSIIPEEYSTLLHSVNVELVVDNDINAIAYSHTKSVQLLQGLPSFVTLASTVGTLMLVIRTPLLNPALYYANQSRACAAAVLLSKDHGEALRWGVEMLDFEGRGLKADEETYKGMLKLRDGQLNDSMMFIFLHEFAHVLLEHTNGPITKLLQQELEADRFATTQMSKNWNRWNPISGILVFSFLEALERINSEDEPLNGDAIHPPASKRRHDELDEAIRLAESSGFTEELMGNILEFTHRSHLILSSELLAHGLTPLSPFHSTQSAKMIGVGSSLFRLSEVIERNYPKIVIDIERLPFEASTHDPIPDLAKRRRIPSLDEIVQDVRKRGKEGKSARYET